MVFYHQWWNPGAGNILNSGTSFNTNNAIFFLSQALPMLIVSVFNCVQCGVTGELGDQWARWPPRLGLVFACLHQYIIITASYLHISPQVSHNHNSQPQSWTGICGMIVNDLCDIDIMSVPHVMWHFSQYLSISSGAYYIAQLYLL